MEKETQELSHMIAEAYSRDLKKPELVSFKEVSRLGRKYGFPIICTLVNSGAYCGYVYWSDGYEDYMFFVQENLNSVAYSSVSFGFFLTLLIIESAKTKC